jgi:hypothetical protein
MSFDTGAVPTASATVADLISYAATVLGLLKAVPSAFEGAIYTCVGKVPL